jgi:hypothetical protein
MLLRPPPVPFKSFPMKNGPFQCHRQSAAGKKSTPDIQCPNIYLGLIPTIESMKMRRRVVIMIHPDNDTEKYTYSRHMNDITNRR